jgi:hypothetical protein
MTKIKTIVLAAVLGLLAANPSLAVAQTTTNTNYTYSGVQGSIEQYLCTPSANADGHDLERCVNKLYRFGIAFGAIALVFFLVVAGYVYMTGGESAKSRAKGIVQNALVGIGLLLGSYVILSFINPSLVVFKPIQPPIFTTDELPDCEALGFGSNCTVASAEPGADFNTDFKYTGSYQACGRSFNNASQETSKVKTISVKVWDINASGQKFSKDLNLQLHECIIERAKKAFSEYYNSPDKFPIKEMGGYDVRKVAGSSVISAHAFGLTIDINPETNCHAENNGRCKNLKWSYKPCPGSGCSPYSITSSSGLYKALKANGFGWGGQWKSSKDYMHFSCVESEQGRCSQ